MLLVLLLVSTYASVVNTLPYTESAGSELIGRRSALTKECSFISCQTDSECSEPIDIRHQSSWWTLEEHEIASFNSPDEDARACDSNIVHHAPEGSTTRQEILSLPQGVKSGLGSTTETESPPLEIQALHISGPSGNRVDLVFFSDGYTQEERDKFIDDASRLAEDISGEKTFSTVQPLLNFWAAFSPSVESGIGTGGKPKDTPFGLYREGTELRAVYYSKPEVAKAACDSMDDRCDYPILLGNDPYYGGLGGEFTVITSSLVNGPLILRHELGHSIIDVGEEYDGGFAYYGPNSANDLESPLPWSHWLSMPLQEPPRVERAMMPFQMYPWTLLNTTTSWSINFTSSGLYSRHRISFSLSGLPSKADLSVELDGRDLEWVPLEGIGKDRWHYDIYNNGGLSSGNHEIKFTLLNKGVEGEAQLCSVEGLEFGNESEFNSTTGYYGIFPTFSETNDITYRPTNEDCLMRDARKSEFCHVCMEGLWLSLLRQVDFLENVREGCQWISDPGGGTKGKWQKTLDMTLVPLAQFRKKKIGIAESYTITWKKDGKILDGFTNKTRIEIDDEIALGTYLMEVKFSTEEVRLDTEGSLPTSGEFKVMDHCRSKHVLV